MTPVVQVEVLEIQPGGVLVKLLADDRTGFIRRGELSWDRRVGVEPPLPQIGERLEAKIIKERKESPEVYLSLRQLIDPWHEVEKTYHPDQVVRGEVVNIRHFGVFVQLEPGLDAIVWPRDMPLRRDQRPADILSIGDQVQGVITLVDPKKHKLELSLTRRLEILSLAPGPTRQSIQIELFRDSFASSKTGPAAPDLPAPLKDQAAHRRYHAPLPKPETLLLIDDNGSHLSEIRQQLEKTFSFDIDSVSSGRAALDQVRSGRTYDLAIIDLKLANEHGTRVAEELLERLPHLAVLFTSLDPQAEKTLPLIKGRTIPFAVKEPEEIAEWIDKLASGYWEESPESTTAYTGPGNVIQQLELTALARRSLPDRLRQMLADLRAETNASQGLVLELDSTSKSVSIIAAEPPLKKDIYEQSLDNLYYSPARDVVEDGTEFHATRIDQDRDARFKNLLPLLAYTSFIGLPLTVPDLAARHALFLFNEHRPDFEPEEIDQARLAAKFMQVALERGLLLDTMRRFEQRYTLGQLLGSLVHELSNKFDGLEGQLASLPVVLHKARTASDPAEQARWLDEAAEAIGEITQAKGELRELVNAYARMVSGDLQAVDVNEVARKVKRQLAMRAREANVEIHLATPPDMPPARTVQSRLEQVLTNLVLNAIQQIERQAETLAQVARESGETVALLQDGLVILQIRLDQAGGAYPIQISVIDTGPGIHTHRYADIFRLDTSVRPKGHGLGLFISRNLVETMGGRLRLADSLIFLGSAFVVELPGFDETGAPP